MFNVQLQTCVARKIWVWHVALMAGQHACYTSVPEPAWKVTTWHTCITLQWFLEGVNWIQLAQDWAC
jgi:hypothetical protein